MEPAFSPADIGRFAHRVQSHLTHSCVRDYRDLGALLGSTETLSNGDEISIELRPSNHGTQAFTLAYIVPGRGIPLEIRLNPALRYTRLIVKCETPLSGYRPWALNPLSHLVQERSIAGSDLLRLKAELSTLAAYAPKA